MVGARYKNCSVISSSDIRDAQGFKQWTCKCDCGATFVRRASILSGISHCGCMSYVNRSVSHKKHGLTKTAEFKSWDGAIQRCTNDRCKDFPNYGGRGISVCDRWIKSFDNFLSDMGKKPSASYSLDRIDVNGDYSPENCRWASSRQQASNRRNNVFVDVGGSKITLFEFCGYKTSPMYQRISYRLRHGWCLSDAIFQPAHAR